MNKEWLEFFRQKVIFYEKTKVNEHLYFLWCQKMARYAMLAFAQKVA